MENLVEVKIDSLRVSLTNQQRIIVLKDIEQNRYLPIWIGPFEAEAITIALQEIEISRPQTHDLFNNMLAGLDAKLLRVVISGLNEDIFYGTLVLESGKKEIQIDSRPSDAIALAVRAHVKIFISAAVMDEASIIPEEIASSTIEEKDTEEKDDNIPAQDRLSIFEEYLKKKPDGDDDEEKDSGKPVPPT